MADYNATPQVVDPDSIELYGNVYRLGGPIQVVMHTTPPPKIRVGDQGRDDSARISSYTWSDLRGGGGLWHIRDLATDSHRFYASGSANTLWPNQIGAMPATNLVTPPGGVGAGQYLQAVMTLNATANLLFVFGADTYNWNGTTFSALIDTLPGTSLYDHIYYNAAGTTPMLFFALGSAGYTYASTVTGSGTDSTAVLAIAWAVWDGKLWSLDTSGVLRYSLDATSWTVRATIPVQFLTLASLLVFPNAAGQSTLWAATPTGLWMYDAEANVWKATDFQYPRYNKAAGDGFQLATVYRGAIYVNTAPRELYQIQWSGQALQVTNVSPYLPDGFSNAALRIKALVATNDLLFVSIGDTITGIVAYNGVGWHSLLYSTSTVSAGRAPLNVIDHDTLGRRLWHGRPVVGTIRASYYELNELSQQPLLVSGTYNTSNNLTLPYYGGRDQSSTKVALRVRVKLGYGTATETIQVAYRINGSTGSFTNLGAVVNSTSEASRWFGTNNVGLEFKSIQLQFLGVNGGSVAAIIEYVTLDYLELPEVLRGFLVDLDLSQEYQGIAPTTMIDNIWTAIETSTLGTFAYRDDAGNTRSFLVKVERPEGLENSGAPTEQGRYRLLLLAMRDN